MSHFTSNDIIYDQDFENAAKSVLLSGDSKLTPVRTDLQPRTSSVKDIKIVLFDIYGTLIISQSGDVGTAAGRSRTEIFLELMESADLAPRNMETARKIEEVFFSVIQSIHAEKKKNRIPFPEVDIISVWDMTFREIIEDLESPPEPNMELLVKLALLHESLSNRTAEMPGLSGLLRRTVESGRKMGIISNAQFYTPLLLEGTTSSSLNDLGFDPELLIWSYMEGMGKPSPELFQKAIAACENHYQVGAEEILYVGNDMRNDIFPAAKTGMKTALFAGDRRSLRLREKDPLYSYVKPDIILTGLGQLTEML